MAVNEYDVLVKYKNADGGITLLYPITKQDNVMTEGDGAAYTANVTSITELKNGVSFVMIPHTVSTTTSPTLNVNGLGAKKIQRRLSNSTGNISAGASNDWLAAEKPIQVIYDGSFWIADLPKPAATDLFGVTPIEKGGTNATTVEEARANILPAVTPDDEGKTLCVSEDGGWVIGKTSGLTTLYVTAPANVTVVATKGDETISEVADSDGLAIFDGLSVGTWTVSITNDYQTVTQTIVVEPDYTASLSFFEAYITVTYPEGSTCTCTDGKTTLTAPDTSGSYTFTVPYMGTWTIACEKIIQGFSRPATAGVTITDDGQSESASLKYFESHIEVNYPVGSTCTCSNGSTTMIASDTSGSVNFHVPNTGTWTVNITNGGRSESTSVSITADGQSKSITLKYFEAYIEVNYPSGSTCTCSNGSTVLTAPDTSGNYTFTVLNTGIWTITCSNNSRTESTTVTITTDEQSETITLKYFEAYIAVIYPEGSTCTCSNGSTVLTAPDTSGNHIFNIPNTGSWTIACSNDTRSESTTVSITADGQSKSITLKYFESYIAVTYPEGSTCTCSNGSTVLTAPDTSGNYTFAVPNTGIWTITCNNNSRSESTTVTITTDEQSETITLKYFEAYIEVNYPSGSTCTCSNGSTVLTASDTSGNYTFTVPNTGTWKIACQDVIQGVSRSAESSLIITEDGQMDTATLKYFEAYITVDYPSGSTCTCSNGSTVLTASDTSGSVIFHVPTTGTWVVSCTDQERSDSEVVNVESDGDNSEITLEYITAYISVIYPSGSTCTCTDGSTTLTASNTNGVYKFTVKHGGNWTIRCSKGVAIKTEDVYVTTDGETVYVEIGSMVYIYKVGGDFDSSTGIGGWTGLGYAMDDTCDTPYLSGDFLDDKNSAAYTKTINEILLDNYMTVGIELYKLSDGAKTWYKNANSAANGVHLCVGLNATSTCPNPQNSCVASVQIADLTQNKYSATLDISNIKGSYNIAVWALNRCAYIDQIYLI